jgi:acetylglutamate kinase
MKLPALNAGTTTRALPSSAAAASALAGALGAKRLVFLTDVEGVLDADGTVIEKLDARAARALLASPAVTGGMKPKLGAAIEAAAAAASPSSALTAGMAEMPCRCRPAGT